MKRTTILAAILLGMCATAMAQDCKHVKETKDKFTNKVTKNAHITIGNLRTKWSVDIEQTDGVTTMKWGIAMVGEYNQRIAAGTKLLLKLADDKVITLETTEPSAPVTQAFAGGAGTVNIFSTYYLRFNLSQEDIVAMAGSVVTDFKVDVPDQKIKNPNTTDHQMEKIQEAMVCFK